MTSPHDSHVLDEPADALEMESYTDDLDEDLDLLEGPQEAEAEAPSDAPALADDEAPAEEEIAARAPEAPEPKADPEPAPEPDEPSGGDRRGDTTRRDTRGAEASVPTRARKLSRRPSAPAMKTLVAIDDAEALDLVADVLRRRKHDVTVCAGREEAWRTCQRSMPSLIVLSSSFLESNGVQLCGLIRALPDGDRAVILAITSETDPKALLELHQAGVNDYLAEPVDESMLKVRLAIAELAVARETKAKRAQESTRRLNFAVQSSPTAVVIADGACNIDYVNPRFTQLTGYSHGEIYGSRILDRANLPDGQVREVRETLAAGYEWRGEVEYQRKQGGTYWAAAAISPVLGPQGEVEHIVEVHEDISERKAAEHELREREELYRAITENAYDLICEIDLEGRFLYVSPSYREGLGYEADELRGREMFAFIHPDDRPAVIDEFVKAIQYERLSGKAKSSQVVFRYRHKNNQWRWFESTGRVNRAGRQFRRVVISRDITERKLADDRQKEIAAQLHDANARLESMTLVDPLTELLNRRGLQQALTREIDEARRAGSDLLVLLIDLDDFKGINDTLGYAVGDVVLKEIARKMRSSVRPTDHVARIGGDEFMILLPATAPSEGIRIAERTRLAVSESPVFLSSGTVTATASFALARVSQDTPSIDELLSQTHPVIRQSKEAGKNQLACELEVSEGSPTVRQAARDEVVNALRRGEGLRTVFHPIYRLADEVIVATEGLTRSTIPNFESPVDFLRVSQEANILTPVDHQCFKRCLETSRELAPEVRCHLNLLPSTIIDIPVEHLLEAFPEGRAKSSYCIEISETQIIGDPSYLREPVMEFKKAGVLIAIDDVGFGRSCLESMVVLEPDIVKIDRKCVSDIAHDRHRARFLKRLFHVAKVLGADVVAEGIETREDLKVLKEVGVAYGQGYLWGAPG